MIGRKTAVAIGRILRHGPLSAWGGTRVGIIATFGLILALAAGGPAPAGVIAAATPEDAADPQRLAHIQLPEPALDPLSVEALFAEPAVRDLALSPDGSKVAVIVRAPGAWALALQETATPGPRRLVLPVTAGDPRWVAWAGDDRLLVGLAQTLNGQPRAVTIAVGPFGANPQIVTDEAGEPGRADGLVHRLPDEPDHALIAVERRNRSMVLRVHLTDGSSRLVARGTRDTVAWMADTTGRVIAREDVSASGVWTLSAPNERDRWRTLETRPAATPYAFAVMGASDAPDELIVRARLENQDTAGLYRYAVEDAAVGERLALDADYDAQGALIDEGTGALLGMAYVADRLAYQWTGPRLTERYEAFRAGFGPTESVAVLDRSADGALWLVYVSGPQRPGDYYLHAGGDAPLQLVARTAARLPRALLSGMSAVAYPAADGTVLTGYLTRPNVRPAKGPPPLLVMPHGGPLSRDALRFDPAVQFFASRGYAVFQPNFRGSAGFGRAFDEAGHGEWGGLMQQDIADGVGALVAMGEADPERVAIIGASYGGYAALAGLVETPELYAAGVAVNAEGDLLDFMRRARRTYTPDAYQFWRDAVGDPRVDTAALETASPARRVDEVNAPEMIVHGARDPVTPVDGARRLTSDLREAGKTVTYLEIENGGHVVDQAFAAEAWPAIEAFLSTHLPAGDTSP